MKLVYIQHKDKESPSILPEENLSFADRSKIKIGLDEDEYKEILNYICNKDYDNDISIDEGNVTGVKDNAVGELTLEEIEQEIIEKTLRKFKSNRRKTAKALNISERTLYRKINEYGMDKKKTSE